MHARSGSLKVSPDRVDDAVQAFESEQLPKYKDMSGYKGFTLLADRGSGQILGVSFWETEDDLRASDELGAEARAQLRDTGVASEDAVRQVWEVVVDDTA
jgi:heme-degrading monooxygenase HmoA